ncbi:unnamed protein product [Rhizophagus irregularis]|nr:unnamed protein product [Rhizophagus irregularis]
MQKTWQKRVSSLGTAISVISKNVKDEWVSSLGTAISKRVSSLGTAISVISKNVKDVERTGLFSWNGNFGDF